MPKSPESQPEPEDLVEYDTILGTYLMEAIDSFIDNNPKAITPNQSKELNPDTTPAFQEAADKGQAVDYLRNWVKRHSIPIDIERLITTGKKNYSNLKERFIKEDSGEEN